MSEELNMDERDAAILSNFAGINKQIQFWPGSTLTSASPGRRLLARAKTTMNIPHTFAIDNLSQLLNAISLFKEPKITINDKYMSIRDTRHKMRYTFTDPENVVSHDPDKKIAMGKSYEFDLKQDILKDIQKAAGVLGMPEVAYVGDGKIAYMQVLNVKNPTSHLYSMPVGRTEDEFRMVMKVEWLAKLFPSDYHVVLDFDKRFANFQSDYIEYWICLEVDD